LPGFIKISPESKSNENLMTLIALGNKEAFEILYDRFFYKLVWFAQSFIADKQKAEDVVQEIFIKIIENPKQFDTSKKFTTWVYTITGNACKNTLRNEQNRSRILEKNQAQNPSNTIQNHAIDKSILKQKIQLGFNELNEKEKSIYTLRFEQELSIKEIADIMNIPEGSVKSGIYYLLKKFTTHLKDFKL
jgi:RNA polymerase sigma-70 factor (ECF subfamily)